MQQNHDKMRSDLAQELVKSTFTDCGDKITRTSIRLNFEQAKKLNKPKGRYISFNSPIAVDGNFNLFPRLSKVIATDLYSFVSSAKKVLVVGLGNPKLTSDALGKATVKRVITGDRVCSLCPLVSGLTGIESFDLVKAVVRETSPSAVIAVDALCAGERSRIATVFQLTDTGIAPGSGVGNFRGWLNRQTLGVPVVSLGVPLVVYLSTLVAETGGDLAKTDRELIVTPKEVDLLVENCAQILADAINQCFE